MAIMKMATELFGDFRGEGYEAKWSYRPASNTYSIQWTGHELLMTGPRPTIPEMLAAIRIFEQGYRQGLEIGKRILSNELKRLLEIT